MSRRKRFELPEQIPVEIIRAEEVPKTERLGLRIGAYDEILDRFLESDDKAVGFKLTKKTYGKWLSGLSKRIQDKNLKDRVGVYQRTKRGTDEVTLWLAKK